MALSYDNDSFKAWANDVLSYINGGTVSIATCSKKFGEQMEILVQPNVWSGEGCKENYDNFMAIHTALVDFSNNFAKEFDDQVHDISAALASLEAANLAKNVDYVKFGSLNRDQLDAAIKLNVNVTKLTYNYDKMSEISSELKRINVSLDDVFGSMERKVETLTNEAMTGNSAEAIKSNLVSFIESNKKDINELFNTCIEHIAKSAENARKADTVTK